MSPQDRSYNGAHAGDQLNYIAFPLGGIGAGMICLEGTGAISHFSLRNRPDVFNEPVAFSAVHVKRPDGSSVARVLEGPVPRRKVFGVPNAGNGLRGVTYGLPRFTGAQLQARFPFASVCLSDDAVPLNVEITGWSPFTPGDADSSSLPVAGLEYTFSNPSSQAMDAVFSFHAANFMSTGSGGDATMLARGGFVLHQLGTDSSPWEEGDFSATTDAEEATVNCAWFRGAWFDPISQVWDDIEQGRCVSSPPHPEGDPSPGASIFVPLHLDPGQSETVRLMLAWFVPLTDLRSSWHSSKDLPCGCDDVCTPPSHSPWYSSQFAGINDTTKFWQGSYDELRQKSLKFSHCFYDSTLPPEVVEAVAANLTILKSPTILRQTDGRLWGWEGCRDDVGCCAGSCTHVWNYAQSIPHLFPDLERGMRVSEFEDAQDESGHQAFRVALPIGPSAHDRPAAADGQLGGILQAYREWRICGDRDWLQSLWPKIRQSLNYCIQIWDPRHTGTLEEPHHNTYDIEFWGPDPMCSSIYLGALKAAVVIGAALDTDVSLYEDLLDHGCKRMQTELFDGEYYFQKVQWQGLNAKSAIDEVVGTKYKYSPEAIALFHKEGPKYQYGQGCLADGIIGAWMAAVSGVDEFLDRGQVISHLAALYNHNFREDLSDHANPQRPGFALGDEGGLLICTWPKGGKPSLPFVYSNEVWTGIEYQVASHMMMVGMVEEGLTLVRTCRDRYDGIKRNPFNEYECGHWYSRAMASYALLQGLTGVRYDAVERTLTIAPRIAGDFRSFFCWATGFGSVGVKDGSPFLEVMHGSIDFEQLDYIPAV